METLILVVFFLGYLAITLEHTLKIDKLIPALAMMAILWALISLTHLPVFDIDNVTRSLHETHIEKILLHHLGKTAEILVFLLGAMTIVEIIDYFDGFATIKSFIRTNVKVKLLWIFSILAFILSAIIDNLTATIVLITILQKVIQDRNTRLWFAGLIIVAANAGGAWSPIGDVTTTMLWIGKKVTTPELIKYLFIPSIVCMVFPTLIASQYNAFRGTINNKEVGEIRKSPFGSRMLYLGLGSILFVPFFKQITHLPPYVGMMLSLAVVAAFAELFSSAKFSLSNIDEAADDHAIHSPVHAALTKIELPSILFFLGILMAVGALESLGLLFNFAGQLTQAIPNMDIVVSLFGVISAVIDNVPLVAASMGMFSQGADDPIWHAIAFAAGTGGSMLVFGSAAGVVAMGMEKINFFWYFKKISILAFVGFLSGYLTFMLMRDYILA
ncbi:MAG: sodium:proton antiporter [Flavobacteriaceae bacterium]|nr:sodium:proton antiporter [Flavobacteriaceae bacterium]|tara:strand:+ start:1463 stop:2791 length:1329 start_codon:yes stop_codon:yes gene_type:complete